MAIIKKFRIKSFKNINSIIFLIALNDGKIEKRLNLPEKKQIKAFVSVKRKYAKMITF